MIISLPMFSLTSEVTEIRGCSECIRCMFTTFLSARLESHVYNRSASNQKNVSLAEGNIL